MMEIFAAVTFKKSDPPLSRSMVRMIGQEFTTNDAAARRELGYVGKTSVADGLLSYKKDAQPAGAQFMIARQLALMRSVVRSFDVSTLLEVRINRQ